MPKYQNAIKSIMGAAPIIPVHLPGVAAGRAELSQDELNKYHQLKSFVKGAMSGSYYHFEMSSTFREDMECMQSDFVSLISKPVFGDFNIEKYIFHPDNLYTWIVSVESVRGRLKWESTRLRTNEGLKQLGQTGGVQSSDHFIAYVDESIKRSGSSINDQQDFIKDLRSIQSAEDDITFDETWMLPLVAALFTKYGEIDTINHFIPKEAVRPPSGKPMRKIARALSKGIVRLSSTWLNNIVVDRDINVRGHFRLQPHGVGKSKRKLIYISPHLRKGYNKAADRWRDMPSDLN